MTLPKGSQGVVLGVSNSKSVRDSYLGVKVDEWFYIVQFPDQEKTIVDKTQVDMF